MTPEVRLITRMPCSRTLTDCHYGLNMANKVWHLKVCMVLDHQAKPTCIYLPVIYVVVQQRLHSKPTVVRRSHWKPFTTISYNHRPYSNPLLPSKDSYLYRSIVKLVFRTTILHCPTVQAAGQCITSLTHSYFEPQLMFVAVAGLSGRNLLRILCVALSSDTWITTSPIVQTRFVWNSWNQSTNTEHIAKN